jgi:hypothetical protein
MSSNKALSKKDMNGLQIENLGAPSNGTDAATKTYVDTGVTTAESRANHTGTQTASTISDFDTQVRASRLDQMAAPTGSVNLNSQKIINLLDPTGAQDGASKNYVDVQLAGLVSGQTLKGSVRAAATTNVSITSAPATVDGVTPSNGDIFLLTGQTTGSENGPRVWTAAGAAMNRVSNWDTDTEAVLGSYWIVREGTKADNFALLSNDTAITLGTTVPAFIFISVAGASIGRYAVNCGAISAGATWTVTHSLNSTDVHVVVKRVASPYDAVDVHWETPDANTVYVIPDIALSSGEYRAIVKY